uniref:F-box domain-containing protein n=1 Tax=Steinernema glaseri TaxID=37863 RepID=A0A1I8ACL5_9BILA
MDDVPFYFYQQCCQLLSAHGLWAAQELSGYYGLLASSVLKDWADYSTTIKDGIERESFIVHPGTNRKIVTSLEIEAVPKKFVRNLSICLQDAKDETVSLKLLRRLPYAECNFVLFSPTINEAWVDFANSLKRLGPVCMKQKKFDSNAIRLLQKLVAGQKLSTLTVYAEACENIMDELTSLLCQNQFEKLVIWNYHQGRWTGAAVRHLLEFWSQNSEKLKGKNLLLQEGCSGGVDQLEQFVLPRALKADPTKKVSTLQEVLEFSSKKECDFIDKEYRHNHFYFAKPSCVYKFEEGEGGEKHRIYISFEIAVQVTKKFPTAKRQHRPANFNGRRDLHLMRNTNDLHILFA